MLTYYVPDVLSTMIALISSETERMVWIVRKAVAIVGSNDPKCQERTLLTFCKETVMYIITNHKCNCGPKLKWNSYQYSNSLLSYLNKQLDHV
jgi:hypothetical protein